jgi:hypothetical protein
MKGKKRGTNYSMGSQKVVLECCLFKKVFFVFLDTLSEKGERGYFVQRGFLKVERSCFCTTFVEHLVDKRFLCVSQKVPTKNKQTNKLKSPQHKNRKANQR